MKTKIAIVLLSLLMGNSTISVNPEKSSLEIFGTSSLHDWESEVKQFSIKGELSGEAISELEVKIKSESIKSGKSIMDDKTYEALKTEDYPVIEFKADQMTISGNEISGTGSLTLAGITKLIDLDAVIISQTAKEIQIQGEVKLNMTAYGIEPPTAMFGSLKTGDEVTIKYDISLNKQ